MKNSELWEQYADYTKELTANCRKLAFAAAGISWFFKTSTNTFPKPILFAIGFTVAFFIADILQFLLSALLLRFWTRSKEKAMWKDRETIDGDYEKPAWLDYPAFTMWWAKVCFLLAGYVCIGVQLFKS